MLDTADRAQRRRSIFAAALLVAAAYAPGALAADVCPKRGGTIRTVDMNWVTMDPVASVDPESYLRLLYDSLIDVTQTLVYRPGLAEAMPEQAGDRGWVFHLRKGVKFHDGTDFNADAVKYAMDRLVSGKVPSPWTGVWRQWLDKLVVVDPYTVRFELKEPWPDFVWNVASTFFVGSPTAIEKFGAEFGTKSAAGTGPFMLKSFTPRQRIEVVRNPNYYRTGEPCVDGVVGSFIASGSVRLLGLRKGELTNVMTFPESQLPLLDGATDVIEKEGRATTLSALVVNTRFGPLHDKRVRQAIQHAIDGKEIVDKVYRGRGEVIESIFPPWHPGFVKAADLKPIRPDKELAKKLMAEAGYGPDKPLKLVLESYNAPAHVERTVLLQAQLKEIGVDLEVKNLPPAQAVADMLAGTHQLTLFQMNGGPTLSDYTWNLFSSKSTKNLSYYNQPGGYEDKAADPILDRIAAAATPEAAHDDIAKLQAILFEDVPFIFMDFRNHRDAWRKEEKGFDISKLKNHQDYRTVWFDK